MTQLRDRAFQAVFSRLLVYTILFEDNERDLEFLAIRDGDRVLSVAGAGCGVAACLAGSPARLDVVDLNRAHLALTALKASAARSLASYEEFHELLARGRHPRPREVVHRLARELPPHLAACWRSGWRMFRHDLYAHGLLRRTLDVVRWVWPITPAYLRALASRPAEERAREVAEAFAHHLRRPLLSALAGSPVALLAAGINYRQRDLNLRALGAATVGEALVAYVSRLVRTDLSRNWIAWHVGTGGFDHEEPECLPVYLRPESHAASCAAGTELRYWNENLLHHLRRAGRDQWSHYCLSDVADWMPPATQATLFREIHRTARPGARVVCRTVEDGSPVEALGLGDRFRLVEPFTTVASREERSCLYQRVNCYEVVK